MVLKQSTVWHHPRGTVRQSWQAAISSSMLSRKWSTSILSNLSQCEGLDGIESTWKVKVQGHHTLPSPITHLAPFTGCRLHAAGRRIASSSLFIQTVPGTTSWLRQLKHPRFVCGLKRDQIIVRSAKRWWSWDTVALLGISIEQV